MNRGLVVSRKVLSAGGRPVVKVTRLQPVRRLATESSSTAASASSAAANPSAAPKKRRGIVRRVLFFTSVFSIAFYGGATAAALNNERFHDFFVESVPLGEAIIDYAESHGFVGGLSNKPAEPLRKIESTPPKPPTPPASPPKVEKKKGDEAKPAVDTAKDKAKIAAEAQEAQIKASQKAQEEAEKIRESAAEKLKKSKEKLQDVARTLGTSIHKHTEEEKAALHAVGFQARQFSEGVADLIREAEEALAGKLPSFISTETKSEPPTSPAPTVEASTPEEPEEPLPKNVYKEPLPLGFEPPPGFILPPKPKAKASPPSDGSLPLVAPSVSELSKSEPVISHLASTIDNLATFVKENPKDTKAKDVLETARKDLVDLGTRLEKVKEEGRAQLQTELDEQAKEFNMKLLEMELDARDKLDAQDEEWKAYFDEEKQKIVAAYRAKLEHELTTQSEIINQRLKEEVIAQGIEMQRRWIREIKVRVEQERGGRLAKLDELATGMKQLERVTLDNSLYLDENLRLHTLWSALRAVNSAVDGPVRKPFREELRVLRHLAAAREDPVITAALDTIEATDVPDVGVEPFADLASWFATSVSPKVSQVALVPDQNAGLLSYLSSSILSSLRFERRGLVEGNDVLSVLARAEYHLNEKDLDSATRELNQLKGASKQLLTDWLDAARRRLEVQQALEVVQAQATLASLLVV